MGARAPRCADAALVVYLSGASLAHGFRAGLAESVLPVATGRAGAEASTRSPGGGFDQAVEVLDGPGEEAELLDALVGIVYPAMAVAYAEHLAVATGPADASVRRTLRRVLADLGDVAADGRALAPARGDSARARRVQELLEAVPGPFGPLIRTS